MDISKTNVPRRIKQKKNETRSLQASVSTVARWGIKLQAAGNLRRIKIRDLKSWKKKEEKEVGTSKVPVGMY